MGAQRTGRQQPPLGKPLLGGLVLLLLAEEAHLVAQGQHAPLVHHTPRKERGFFDIVGRTGAHALRAQEQGFGFASGQRHGDMMHQFALFVEQLFLWHGHAVARRAASGGDDGYLADLAVRQEHGGEDGVTRLMGGGHLALVRKTAGGGAFHAKEQGVQRALHIRGLNGLRVALGRQDGGFVEQAFQLRAGKQRRVPRQRLQRHLLRQRLAARVHLKDAQPLGQPRQRRLDLPVEAPGAQQRFVQGVQTVGRSHDHHAVAFAKAAHLG